VNRAIIYTEGGGPSAFQRKRFREASGDRPPKCAVMMDSPMIRTIVTLMNLFSGGAIKIFATHDWDGAFAYAEVPPEEQQEIKELIEKLKNELAEQEI
jgi:hypothetical protein